MNREQFESLSETLGFAQRTIELARTIRGDELALAQPAAMSTSIQDAVEAEPAASLPSVQVAQSEARTNGDFALGSKLGEGGMGEVFIATQRSLRREVAIKRVKDGYSGAATALLVSEARTAGRLEHPNVVPVHVLGTDEEGRAVPRERDPRASGRALAALTTFVLVVTLVAVGAIGDPSAQRGALWSFVAMDATVLSLMVMVIAVWRKKFFASQYGRAVTVLVCSAIAAGMIADVFSALQGRATRDAAPFTLIAIGAPLVAAGGYFGKWIALSGLASIAGAGLCVMFPSKVHWIMVLSEFATLAMTVPMMRKGLAKDG